MKKNIFLSILVVLFITSCNSSSNPNSTRLNSSDIPDRKERVAILKKEIKSFSGFSDAEYILINANGFSDQRNAVPGASSVFYRFAIKVDTADMDKWTNGMTEAANNNEETNWPEEIPADRKEAWKAASTPVKFTRPGENVTMLVYRKEGIIYKQIIID